MIRSDLLRIALILACIATSGCHQPSLRITSLRYPEPLRFQQGVAIRDGDHWLIMATFYDQGSRFIIDDESKVSLLLSLPATLPNAPGRAFITGGTVWERMDGTASVDSVNIAIREKSSIALRCRINEAVLYNQSRRSDDRGYLRFAGNLDRIEVSIVPNLPVEYQEALSTSGFGETFNVMSPHFWTGWRDADAERWKAWNESRKVKTVE